MIKLRQTLASAAMAALFLAQPLSAQDNADQDPRMQAVEQQLAQMKADGAGENVLMIVKAMGLYQVGLDQKAQEQIAAIQQAIPAIIEQEGDNSVNVLAAKALVELAAAKQALDADDIATAKEKLGAAFFYMPEIASSVSADWVYDYWDRQVFDKLAVPMDKPLELAAGGTTTLADIAKGKKAVYIDVWASWCGPCMAAMPDLKARSAEFTDKGIAFVGLNTESSTEAEAVAKQFDIGQTQLNWLVDDTAAPLADTLLVEAYPTVYLISPEGKVLWTGHPNDPALLKELNKLTQG